MITLMIRLLIAFICALAALTGGLYGVVTNDLYSGIGYLLMFAVISNMVMPDDESRDQIKRYLETMEK